MSTITTPTRPDLLVGSWVRLARDGGRPPHLGVLTRAVPDPDHAGLWHWALRTPTGHMVGGPHLPIEALTRDHPQDVARARRALSRQIRADRNLLAALLDHGEPIGVMAQVVAELEGLGATLTAQLKHLT